MKICPSCGSSVRDAAAECPSCEFDFEEGSSATMRGVAPVDSDKSDGEPEETAEEPGEGEREPRETAFGMPTADSRPGRVPDVTDDGDSASESHSGDSGADGSSPQADEQGDGATTSIPRDELQGILGSPDSEQDDPGGATKSIERDSLDQLVGDLDDSAESTSSDTATGQNKSLSRGDESPTSAPNPNESAIPTMHRGDEDDSTEEPGARETAEQSGGEEDTSSTRFGMPAVDRDTADGDDGGASEQGTRGPAPGLSPSSSVVDSDDETTSGEPAGNERETAEADASPLGPASGQSPSIDDGEAGDSPTKTLMGMSAAPKEGASGEKSRSSSETSTDPDDMTGPERETAEQEAEPFNIKGFQETGDSQAAEIGTRDSDPIDPPEIEDTGADDSQADESESAAPASEGREEQSEEELWSATIEQDDPGGPDALEDGGDAHQRETSPPSAASLFDESDPEEGSPRDGDFAFEHGPSDDEGSTDESGGSATPAAKASGIVRPKNRASSDRESTDDIAENQPDEQSESGLIGGGTYMVRGDGGGLEDDSDLEEVDPGGIDW